MPKLLVTYLSTAAVMVLIDLVWLGLIAKPMYQQGIGHLMAEKPKMAAAISFYLLFPMGLMVFAILPEAADGNKLQYVVLCSDFLHMQPTTSLTLPHSKTTLSNWP
jgi:uncharacterized membrane protein